MKIVHEETLISVGAYAISAEWLATRSSLHKAIREVDVGACKHRGSSSQTSEFPAQVIYN